MKQITAIVLMLLVSGATARAAMLCARLICPMPVAVCCCQETGQAAEPTVTPPMTCDGPASASETPKLKVAGPTCCTVSSPSQNIVGGVPPTLSPRTSAQEHCAQATALVHMLADPPLDRMAFSPTTIVPCLDRSDTYLLAASFRI